MDMCTIHTTNKTEIIICLNSAIMKIIGIIDHDLYTGIKKNSIAEV